MATEFPVDPEFNRFIAGLKDVPEAGVEIELPPEDAEVEELEDGSARVVMGEFDGPEEDEDFYANLAETVNLFDLDKMRRQQMQRQVAPVPAQPLPEATPAQPQSVPQPANS